MHGGEVGTCRLDNSISQIADGHGRGYNGSQPPRFPSKKATSRDQFGAH